MGFSLPTDLGRISHTTTTTIVLNSKPINPPEMPELTAPIMTEKPTTNPSKTVLRKRMDDFIFSGFSFRITNDDDPRNPSSFSVRSLEGLTVSVADSAADNRAESHVDTAMVRTNSQIIACSMCNESVYYLDLGPFMRFL